MPTTTVLAAYVERLGPRILCRLGLCRHVNPAPVRPALRPIGLAAPKEDGCESEIGRNETGSMSPRSRRAGSPSSALRDAANPSPRALTSTFETHETRQRR